MHGNTAVQNSINKFKHSNMDAFQRAIHSNYPALGSTALKTVMALNYHAQPYDCGLDWEKSWKVAQNAKGPVRVNLIKQLRARAVVCAAARVLKKPHEVPKSTHAQQIITQLRGHEMPFSAALGIYTRIRPFLLKNTDTAHYNRVVNILRKFDNPRGARSPHGRATKQQLQTNANYLARLAKNRKNLERAQKKLRNTLV